MAKEFTVEKAFRKTVSKTDKTPQEFKSHDKVMWPWMVKVDGEDFWFTKNTLENGAITPGDTMYGLFDEEEVTPKNGGESFTIKKFVKVDRPDGSYDKVQARENKATDGQLPAPTGNASLNNDRLEYAISLLEKMVPIVLGEDLANPEESEDGEDDAINLDDINI